MQNEIKYISKLFEQFNTTYPISGIFLSTLDIKIFFEENKDCSFLDHEKIDITYKQLLFLVCIFQYFFKQVERDKNLKHYLSREVSFPQPKNDIQIGNQYNLSEKFRTIKKANICLFKKVLYV